MEALDPGGVYYRRNWDSNGNTLVVKHCGFTQGSWGNSPRLASAKMSLFTYRVKHPKIAVYLTMLLHPMPSKHLMVMLQVPPAKSALIVASSITVIICMELQTQFQDQDLVLIFPAFLTPMVVIITVRGTSKRSTCVPHLVLVFQMFVASLLQMHAVFVGVESLAVILILIPWYHRVQMMMLHIGTMTGT